jgi:hypothetical protein
VHKFANIIRTIQPCRGGYTHRAESEHTPSRKRTHTEPKANTHRAESEHTPSRKSNTEPKRTPSRNRYTLSSASFGAQSVSTCVKSVQVPEGSRITASTAAASRARRSNARRSPRASHTSPQAPRQQAALADKMREEAQDERPAQSGQRRRTVHTARQRTLIARGPLSGFRPRPC